MSSLDYRPEIDGLRAVAVLPVVLFHAGFDWIRGGFLGVDVFFVISGYLITMILLSEIKVGSFSLLKFWDRRARRILPALFLVLIVSIPAAWLLLLPKELWEFKENVGSIPLFLSNHLLLDQSGYFDTAAERKPLLHTWSLSVEEQFYLLFPPFLILLTRFREKFVLFSVLILTLSSLGLAEWLSELKPAAAFYLLPTRAWELGVGSCLAIHMFQQQNGDKGKPTQNSLGILGLGMIFTSIFFYSPEIKTPSFYTLLPVLGTAFVICGASRHNLVGRLLGVRVLVGLGLISYSLYLWHQPLLAFAKVQSFDNLSLLLKATLIFASILLAYISWKWVERPFRDKKKVSARRLVALALLGSFIFIYTGVDGYTDKQAFRKANALSYQNESNASILLLGDSHASHLLPGLNKLLPGQVVDLSRAGCLPLYGVDRFDSRGVPGECIRAITPALDLFQKEEKYKTIILSSMGPVYLTGEAFRGKDEARVRGMKLVYTSDPKLMDRWAIFESGLRDTLALLTRSGKNIIFALDVPELGVDPTFCDTEGKSVTILGTTLSIRRPDDQRCFVPRSMYDDRVKRYKNLVGQVLKDYPGVHLFDPTDIFCNEERCSGILDNKPLYKDADHLTGYGAYLVVKKLLAEYPWIR